MWEKISETRAILSNPRKTLDIELVKTLTSLAANLKQARYEDNEYVKNIKIYKVEENLSRISALLTKLSSETS